MALVEGALRDVRHEPRARAAFAVGPKQAPETDFAVDVVERGGVFDCAGQVWAEVAKNGLPIVLGVAAVELVCDVWFGCCCAVARRVGRVALGRFGPLGPQPASHVLRGVDDLTEQMPLVLGELGMHLRLVFLQISL